MIQLRKKLVPTTAENLAALIEEQGPELTNWPVTQNFNTAQVRDLLILRVNAGDKAAATGLVAFGHLSDVNVEDRSVSIRIDEGVTAKLMKNPVPLTQLRRVIPWIGRNLGDVTPYRAEINKWLREAGLGTGTDDSAAKIVRSVCEEMGIEGTAIVRTHVAYERDPRNRDRVLAKHARPYKCQVCGFSFDDYGEEYGEFIHVHHLKPLSGKSSAGRPRITDFALLCANCHAAVHWKRGKTPLPPEQLRKQLARRSSKTSSKSRKARQKKIARPDT